MDTEITTLQLLVKGYCGASKVWFNPRTGDAIDMEENRNNCSFEQYREAARAYLSKDGDPVVSGAMGSGCFMPNDVRDMGDYPWRKPPGEILPSVELDKNHYYTVQVVEATKEEGNWQFKIKKVYQPSLGIWQELLATKKQAEWADLLGCSQSFVSQMKTGQRELPQAMKRRIAAACGYRFSETLERVN